MDWLKAFFGYFRQVLQALQQLQKQNQALLDQQQKLSIEIKVDAEMFALGIQRIEGQLREIIQAVVIHETVSLSAVLEDPDGTTHQGDAHMKFLVSDSKTRQFLRVQPTDQEGFQSRIDGAITVEGADDTLITIANFFDTTLQLDYLKRDPGTIVDFTVVADADLGDGVKRVELPIELEFVAGETTGLGVTLGDDPPAEEPVTA